MTTNYPYITYSDGSRRYGPFDLPEISTEHLRLSYTYSHTMRPTSQWSGCLTLCCDIPMFEGADTDNTVHLLSMAGLSDGTPSAKHGRIWQAGRELHTQISTIIQAVMAQYYGDPQRAFDHISYGATLARSLDKTPLIRGEAWIEGILNTMVSIEKEFAETA